MADETSTSGAPLAPPYYPQDQRESGEKKGLGCFLWGCIAVIALGVVGMAAIAGLGYYGLTQLRDQYTDTQPMALAPLQLNEEDRVEIKTRFDEFRESVDQGTATEPLILDEDDVNALIAEADSKNPFRDSLRVEMEGDTVKSQLSLPMDDFPLPGFKGRYLNGTADLRATLKDGDLEVRVESLTVKGEPLPSQLMDELRKENLAAEMMNDPEARKSLSNLESIEIRDGKLIVVPRPSTGDEAEDGAADGESLSENEGIDAMTGADTLSPTEP